MPMKEKVGDETGTHHNNEGVQEFFVFIPFLHLFIFFQNAFLKLLDGRGNCCSPTMALPPELPVAH